MRIEREGEDGSGEGPIVVGSISEALSALRERFDPVDGSTAAAGGRGGGGSGDSSAGTEKKEGLGRVFVIGGAEVYAQALKMPECERVLRTRIEKEFECDVFFSERLDGSNGWRKSGKREFDDWVGETVPEWLQRQGDVEWEYEMWERNSVN